MVQKNVNCLLYTLKNMSTKGKNEFAFGNEKKNSLLRKKNDSPISNGPP